MPWCGICIVQIQPRKHVLDRADCAAVTQKHELDRSYRSYRSSSLEDLDHQGGIIGWMICLRCEDFSLRLPCSPPPPIIPPILPPLVHTRVSPAFLCAPAPAAYSLRPLIEELKAVRKKCSEVDAEYQQRKGAHEKVLCPNYYV